MTTVPPLQPFWRRRLLVPALVVAGVNAAVFLGFTLPRLIQERTLTADLETLRAAVERDRGLAAAEQRWTETLRANAADTEKFYKEVVGTHEARLVPLLKEIEKAAKAQGLGIKQGASYQPHPLKGVPLVRFTIAMPVTGTYAQLVQYLDRIERSKQFLIVESIALNERRAEGGADMSVIISAYFSDTGDGGSRGL